jgi:hypothetical protein
MLLTTRMCRSTKKDSVIRAGFPAIDTVEDTWVFTNATTNVSHGLLIQGETADSGLLPLVKSMAAAVKESPLMRWPFSGC